MNAPHSSTDRQAALLEKYPPPASAPRRWPWHLDPTESPAAAVSAPWPKITIITPSYNQGAFIEETIRSIVLQGYPNLEYIVMDGGSTDESATIIRKYADELASWVSAPDGGQSAALNKGFAASTGEIMAWICADDILLPGALFHVAVAFQQDSSVQLVCGKGRKMDGAGNLLPAVYDEDLILANLHNWCCICTPSAFWGRSLWEKVGGRVDENNHYTMDWELLLRMRPHAVPLSLDAWLVSVRFHELSKSIQGCVHQSDHASARDCEVVAISRKFGGLLCYNSVLYEVKKLTRLAELFRSGPRLLYSAVFRLVHLPIRILHLLYGRPKSNLMTDFDHSNPQ